MTKRFFIIVGVFLFCAAGTYFVLKPKPTAQTHKALAYLKQNQFLAAEKALKALSSQQKAFPLSLYFGYLEQARGRFEKANFFFQMALKEPKKGLKDEVLEEILLAKAANAYFEMHDHEFFPLVETAQKFSTHHASLLFFEGLVKYLQAQYDEALHVWQEFSIDREEDSQWTISMIERFFPHSWRELHIAHCLVEEGDILSGREILEKQSHQVSDQELHNLATLFLGLTYLKEAQQIPFTQRGTYYKLAHFYFERAKTYDRFARERKQIITHVEKEATSLLLTDLDEEQLKWGFDFIHILQEWKAETAIEKLVDALTEKMLKQSGQETMHLCQAIRKEFLNTPFHLLLTQKLLAHLAHGLKEGETEDLFEGWAMIESLSSSPKLAAKEIATLTSSEIFQTINRDDKMLTRTRYCIAFWEKLGRHQTERETLARELLMHAKVFWHKEGQEKKGERLMEIALKLSNHHASIQKEIETFLTSLYTLAENSNLIQRLTHIYDAMERFQINKQELVSAAKLANHLADAQYLYQSRNYPAAKTHAFWVLKLDPTSEEARRLVGLSAFHLGEYAGALVYLKQLTHPDENAQKALMLSQVFASQEQEKQICQIDYSDSFEE